MSGFLTLTGFWVHLLAAIAVVVFVCSILQCELQAYSRFQEASVSAQIEGTTILVVSASRSQLTFESIQHHFSSTSGGIRSIKMNRDYRSMHAKIKRRAGFIMNLEAAETYLIRRAQVARRNAGRLPRSQEMNPLLWRKYLCAKDRPSMRLPLWGVIPAPFVGTKVDTIYHCRAEIVRHSLEIKQDQQQPQMFPLLNSAFVHFNQRLSTPLPLLALKTRIPPSWTLKHGTAHSDIIWSNVSIGWWEQFTRTTFVYAVALTLILGFGFPVTVAGSLSQISYLANIIPALSSVEGLPNWLIAIIQGVLPPAMLALITAIVPIVLRMLADLQGSYSRHAVETTVQTYYFIFLFVQVFVVVSLSASITTVVEQLRHGVESIPALLVQNLPKASNYFFSYLIINTSSTVTGTLMLPTELFNILLSPILDKSARQKWLRREDLHLKRWGTFVPVYTNLACIGIVCPPQERDPCLYGITGLIYAVIAPLILVISTIVFGALWVLYRRNPPRLSDAALNGHGQFYPVAIHQLFMGLYFMELSLAGLFFLVRDSDGNAACIGQAVIMILTAVSTALFHGTMDYTGRPKWRSLLLKFKRDTVRHCQETGKEGSVGLAKSHTRMSRVGVNIDNEYVCASHIIWVPQDSLGVAVNEIHHMKKYSEHLAASTKGAYLDRDGSIVLESRPPDWQD